MSYHEKTKKETLQELSADSEHGLTGGEVNARRERGGENKLQEKKKKSMAARVNEEMSSAALRVLAV